MITALDYQMVIDLAGEALKYALPIGIVFGIAERLGNMIVSAVTGEKRVRI